METFATAGGAGGVGTVAGEEDADVHLVGSRFHPVEEAFDAIPLAGVPEFLKCFEVEVVGLTVSVVDPVAGVVIEVFPCGVDVDAAFAAVAEEVVLAFVATLALEGFDRALGEGESGIRDGFFEVDSDDPAEAAAGRACAERGVEGEEGGSGRAEGESGGRVVPARAEGTGFFGGRD